MGERNNRFVLGDEYADLLAAPEEPAVAEAADIGALCGKLIGNLAAQRALYADYVVQAGRQRLALVNRRLQDHSDVNAEADSLLNSLGALEEERISITAGILGPRRPGAASTPFKCEEIYPLVDPAQAARLKACRDALIGIMAELKRELAINQALVENGSRIVHTTIGIMTSVVGRTKAEKMNTYTAKGGVHVGKMQIRNLVNRSV